MAQLIFKDSGLLIEAERSAADYLADPSWDPATQEIVDTGQTWDPLVQPPNGPATGRVPQREVWFYFPTLSLFFESTRRKHAIESAFSHIFGSARADEIIDHLERFGPWRQTLDNLDLRKAKRKVLAAVAAGHITAGEAQQLRDLVAHIINGP